MFIVKLTRVYPGAIFGSITQASIIILDDGDAGIVEFEKVFFFNNFKFW